MACFSWKQLSSGMSKAFDGRCNISSHHMSLGEDWVVALGGSSWRCPSLTRLVNM